jgi:hypothetical protein
LWRWEAQQEAAWFFVTVPVDMSDEIGVQFATRTAGFGSLRVEVTIGTSTWRTSIFPDKQRGAFVLPVKKQVRTKEHLEVGGTAKVELRVIA